MTPHDWLNSENTVKRSKKPYAHFDLRTDIGKQKSYISNPHKVAAHGFYPFIHYQIKTIKFNKTKGPRVKTRDICYAAHIDRCIYQYYSFMLNELYNERVRIDGTSDVAVAYRTDLHKSNIYFSKRAFDYIKELGRCYVMIGDFTHFFDNLDHDYLKRQWCSLLKCDRLPDDHYSVFKNVTAYSKWELTDLLALNGLSDDWAGRKNLNSQVRVLMPRQFKENRSHIVKNANHYGIPQGSPISATLANVYMLEVDKLINDMIFGLGGKYMRYSDDFIIILPDDGRQVSIRAKTISKYYYRMYRKANNIAKAGGYTPAGKHISCENLYRRYSERGADGKPGNFLTYVSRAEREYGSDEAITRDTKRHMQKIRKALDSEPK